MHTKEQQELINAIVDGVVNGLSARCSMQPLLAFRAPELDRREDKWWYVNGRKDHYDPDNLGFYESATPIAQLPPAVAVPKEPTDSSTPDAPWGWYKSQSGNITRRMYPGDNGN